MKTPKEKADEIFNSMFINQNNGSAKEDVKFAKQCALIAVDEILKAVESDWSFMEVRQKYWQEVKQEIEKLS